MPFYVSTDDLNGFQADQWSQQAHGQVADQWAASAVADAPDRAAAAEQAAQQAAQQQAAAQAAAQAQAAAEAQRQADEQARQQAAAQQAAADQWSSQAYGQAATAATGVEPAPAPAPPAAPAPQPAPQVDVNGGATQTAAAVGAPTPLPSASSGNYVAYAWQAAQNAGLDPNIFVRQIQQESGFNPNAKSPAGAIGIAQFMPGTAQGVGVDPTNPLASLDAAAKLMASYVQKYAGDYSRALAAYNAGPGNVDKFGGVPPFAETQSYVKTILGDAAGLGAQLAQRAQEGLGAVGQAVGGAVQGAGQAAQTAANYVFPVQGYSGDVALHWGDVPGGSDLFAPRGTPVLAMRGGKVVEAGYNSIGGNSVLIQGDDGNQYYYAHLNEAPSVSQNQIVGTGTYLGPVGNTGDAAHTGTHLHIGIGPSILLGSDKFGGTGGNFDAVGLLRRVLSGQGAQQATGPAAGPGAMAVPAGPGSQPAQPAQPQAQTMMQLIQQTQSRLGRDPTDEELGNFVLSQPPQQTTMGVMQPAQAPQQPSSPFDVVGNIASGLGGAVSGAVSGVGNALGSLFGRGGPGGQPPQGPTDSTPAATVSPFPGLPQLPTGMPLEGGGYGAVPAGGVNPLADLQGPPQPVGSPSIVPEGGGYGATGLAPLDQTGLLGQAAIGAGGLVQQVQSPNTGNPLIDIPGVAASALGTTVHAISRGLDAVSPSGGSAVTVAGSDQLAQEFAARGGLQLQAELQDLQSRRLNGETGLEPQIQQIGAQLNAINQGITQGQPYAQAVEQAAERNPNLPALQATAGVAAAGLATPLAAEGAPLIARAIAEALQPGTNPAELTHQAFGLLGHADTAGPLTQDAVRSAFESFGQRWTDNAAQREADLAKIGDARGFLERVRDNLAEAGRGVLGQITGQTRMGIAADTPEIRQVVDNAAPVAADADRFYHGTGADFPRPDAAQFDPNGLFGPGYYLTDDPRVAGGDVALGGEIVREGKTFSSASQRGPDGRFMPVDTTYREPGEVISPGYAQQRNVDPSALAEADRLEQALQNATPQYRADNEGWMQEQINRLRGSGGPNVRAVDVPKDLNLFNVDVPVTPDVVHAIANQLPEALQQTFINRVLPAENTNPMLRINQRGRGPATGEELYRALDDLVPFDQQGQAPANRILARAGFDGIEYAGGQRTPMFDRAFTPIEHTAVVVFPDSLNKLTNATAGTRGGFLPDLVGESAIGRIAGRAAIGGVSAGAQQAQQPGATPQDVATAALQGAALGGTQAALLGNLPGLRRAVGPVMRAIEEGGGGAGDPPIRPPTEVGAPPPPEPEPGLLNRLTQGQQPEQAGNITLSKYPEDVRQVISDAASSLPEQMKAAARGVLPDQVVRDLSQQTGIDVGQIVQNWNPGQAQNAETLLALRDALTAQARKVIDAQQALRATPDSAVARGDLLEALTQHAAIQEVVSGSTAEAGRALRQFRQAAPGSDFATNQISQMAARSGMTPEEMASALGRVDLSNPTAVAQLSRSLPQGPPTLAEIFKTYHTNNVISGLPTLTHVAVNSILAPAWSFTTRSLADLAGLNFDRVQGGGIGLGAGLSHAGEDFLTGFRDVLNNPSSVANRLGGPGGAALKAQGVFGALHGAFQNVAQGIIERTEIGRLAGEAATDQGLKGVAWTKFVADALDNPSAAMVQQARGVAERAALRGELGTLGQKMQQIANVPFIGNTLFPVVKISTNALTQGIERSPLGLLGTGFDVARATAGVGPYAKGFEPVAGAVTPLGERLTNNLAGTAVTAFLVNKGLDGTITGDGPSDPKERAELTSQGWQANSLWIPGRGYVDYRVLGPIAQDFALVGNYADAVEEARKHPGQPTLGQNALEIAGNLAQRQASYMSDATGLRTLGQIYEVLHGGANAASVAAQFFGQMAGGFVPESAAVRGLVSATDPYARQSQRGDIGEVIAQGLPGGTPGIGGRTDLPVRLNEMGQPEANPQAGLGIFVPRTGTGSVSPVMTLLGSEGLSPPSAPKTVRVGQQEVTLSVDEQRQYQQLRGALLEQMMTPLTQNQQFAQAPGSARKVVLQRLVNQADQVAQRQLIGTIAQSGDFVSRLGPGPRQQEPVPFRPPIPLTELAPAGAAATSNRAATLPLTSDLATLDPLQQEQMRRQLAGTP